MSWAVTRTWSESCRTLLDPLSLIIAADNGAILYFSRQYDRAIEKWRSVLEVDPEFSRAHLIDSAYVDKGMFDEALADVENERDNPEGAWYWGWTAYIRGRSGRKAEARHALHELLQLNRRGPVDPRIIAFAFIGVGDKDQALTWLEKAAEQHSNELTSLKVNPAYDSLRGEPRFQALLHRVGLAE
jgi:tetratricopeptide (TPR) repeat protein